MTTPMTPDTAPAPDISGANSVYRLKGSLATGSHWWRVRALRAGSVTGAWSTARKVVR